MVSKDNVLITITTAANMGGIEQARAGLLSLTPATLGLTVAVAGAVMAGKSMIEISEQQQKAHASLAQAVKVSGGNIAQTDAYLRNYIDTNRSYLSSQSDVETSYGALLRSGIPVTEAQKDLNRATDLAALKGISLTDATDLLIAAEHGRTRGLIDLGISTTKYTDAQGNVINQGKNMALVMQEIDKATAHGRDTLTQTQQISNRISMDWQDLASKGGPPLLDMLDQILIGADNAYTALAKIGSDPHGFDGLNDALVGVASWIHDYLILPLSNAWNLLNDFVGGADHIDNVGGTHGLTSGDLKEIAAGQAHTSSFGRGGRASGGPVSAGATYVVGERGPETLHMGAQGGYITPNGAGGGHVHIHLDGIYAGDGPSLDILANKIALRLGYATGR